MTPRHRHISFFLTTQQIRARTKTVTRRMGWRDLKPGTRLWAVVKGQGLKKGERVERLCLIEVTIVRRERLGLMVDAPAYGRRECVREGFPHLTPEQFVAFFCQGHKGVTPDSYVTRIEFSFVEDRP